MRYEALLDSRFRTERELQNGSEPYDRQQDATGLQLRCGEKRRGVEKTQDVPSSLWQERDNSTASFCVYAGDE